MSDPEIESKVLAQLADLDAEYRRKFEDLQGRVRRLERGQDKPFSFDGPSSLVVWLLLGSVALVVLLPVLERMALKWSKLSS